jgi:hypothetical protein
MSLAIQATSPEGKSYFSSGGTTTRQLSFDAPAGDLVLKVKVLDARGEEIDNSNRRLTVPGFDASKVAIGSPMVLRTRTARDARAIAEGGDGQPEVRREFDRSDRLFIRFPVYGGQELTVAARLLTRQGKELRALPATAIREGIYQLEVPLSVSLRDDYVIAIEATRGADSASAMVPFRVR